MKDQAIVYELTKLGQEMNWPLNIQTNGHTHKFAIGPCSYENSTDCFEEALFKAFVYLAKNVGQ